jgi:hypothetical protein
VGASAQTRQIIDNYGASDFLQLASRVKNITAQGIATITLLSTEFQKPVVVSHGLGGAPTNIQLTGSDANYIYVWELVGETTFTIRARHRAGTAAAATLFVYWQASKEG